MILILEISPKYFPRRERLMLARRRGLRLYLGKRRLAMPLRWMRNQTRAIFNSNYMRKTLFLLCIALLLVAYKRKVPSEFEMYGNTFGCIIFDDFEVPSDWVKYNLMDSACSIMMPPSMRQTVLDVINLTARPQTRYIREKTITWMPIIVEKALLVTAMFPYISLSFRTMIK